MPYGPADIDRTVLTFEDGSMLLVQERASGFNDDSLLMVGREGEIFPKSPFLSSKGYASPYIQTNLPYRPIRSKTDEDGDGVEDNYENTREGLDAFFDPNVFNTSDDVYNTRHGGLPGSRSKEFYDS